MKTIDITILQSAITGSAAAFRARTRLQPAGGEGDKVFPPTFAGAVYAVEKRRVPNRDEPVTCVLLDSVQSQANRMELALQEALEQGEIKFPLIGVDFSEYAPTGNVEADREAGRLLDELGLITSLQVPHRLADAILRDSELDGKPFRESEAGIGINKASLRNATPVYQYCPTALVFGMWDSTGPKGGLGAKFERALVSEVVGIGASIDEIHRNRGVRRDPLEASKNVPIKKNPDGSWEVIDNSKGKASRASEINHGSVPFDSDNAGVTIEYAEQLTTLSLIALRRLGFPTDGSSSSKQDAAGQTVLAALGLCAATLAFEAGMGLRSRCLLWPEKPLEWELLAKPGAEAERFTLDRTGAIELLNGAIAAAKKAGIDWHDELVTLKPSKQLLDLVRRSQELAVKEGVEGEDS